VDSGDLVIQDGRFVKSQDPSTSLDTKSDSNYNDVSPNVAGSIATTDSKGSDQPMATRTLHNSKDVSELALDFWLHRNRINTLAECMDMYK